MIELQLLAALGALDRVRERALIRIRSHASPAMLAGALALACGLIAARSRRVA